MTTALLGRKVGMTQIFEENGAVVPVTVLRMGPCHVLQVRTPERDGYHALQIGFEDRGKKHTSQAAAGHASKAGVDAKRVVREIRLDGAPEQEPGAELTVSVFDEIGYVDIVGTMKGRGYAGVMKRHGFGGLETTHGVQRKHRAPGSIGCSAYPARVIKGRRMNGQYGNTRNTVRNLKVVRVDAENGCLLVRGGVPGPNGGVVLVRNTKKRKGRGAKT